jgi:hypothetical protein
MSKIFSFHLLIILLFLFNYETCQDFSDQDVMKALACISIIKHLDNKNLDQHMVSGYMISCFINIDDSTVHKVIGNQLTNDLQIDKSQIDKLIDFSGLQSQYSQNDILEYSKKLNSAIEKLQSQQNERGQNGMPSGRGGSKNKGSKEDNSENEAGLIPFMIRGIIGLFNPNDSFLALMIFFVLAYFGLKSLRKLFGNNSKNITIKKKTKSN